jgi:hypothetical protein
LDILVAEFSLFKLANLDLQKKFHQSCPNALKKKKLKRWIPPCLYYFFLFLLNCKQKLCGADAAAGADAQYAAAKERASSGVRRRNQFIYKLLRHIQKSHKRKEFLFLFCFVFLGVVIVTVVIDVVVVVVVVIVFVVVVVVVVVFVVAVLLFSQCERKYRRGFVLKKGWIFLFVCLFLF